MHQRLLRFRAWAMFAALALVSAKGATQTASDRATAEALYQNGRELLVAGKVEQACPKFEASQRLDPGLGTLMLLSDCYEKLGKTASAWATFKEAAAVAKAQQASEREQVARARAGALEAKLSTLTVSVAPEASALSDLRVTLNGNEVPRAQWGLASPVDPGDQLVRAEAPGYDPFEHTLSVAEGPSESIADVPALVPAPTAPDPQLGEASGEETEPAPLSSPPESQMGPLATTGVIVGAVGLVGIVAGSLFGLSAKSTNDESKDHCPEKNRCLPDGLELREDAQESATLSTVGFVLGGALVATGVALYVLDTPSRDVGLGLGARLAAGDSRLLLWGSF